jgi:hypothetical protein
MTAGGLASCLIVLCLAACGSGKSAPKSVPDGAVALIGDTPITKPTLNHWMNSIVGGDYYERFGKRAPLGLVSEPANYPKCIRAASSLANENNRVFTAAQISLKCHQLYRAIEEQTLSFLISVQWRIDEAAEQGITISDAAIAAYNRQDVAKRYPKPGEFDTFLADHEWALSDQLYQLKRNLLTTKLREKVSHRSSKSEETPQSRGLFVNFVLRNIKKRTTTTLCRPSYAVSTCRGYRPSKTQTPAPILILEELTGR